MGATCWLTGAHPAQAARFLPGLQLFIPTCASLLPNLSDAYFIMGQAAARHAITASSRALAVNLVPAPCSFHCFLLTALPAVTSSKVWLASSPHTYTCMLCCSHSALHCTDFSEWLALCYHCIRKTANEVVTDAMYRQTAGVEWTRSRAEQQGGDHSRVLGARERIHTRKETAGKGREDGGPDEEQASTAGCPAPTLPA